MSQPRVVTTKLRGRRLIKEPLLAKGTAFTPEEREALLVQGHVPATYETLDDHIRRIDYEYDHIEGDDLARHVYLRALQDRNEILFYAFLQSRLKELMPIVYTPTVGAACQQFSRLYRVPRGMYLCYRDRNRMHEQLASIERDIDVIVVTDGERILGLGDQGVGGMGIPIGKLALYTGVGGIPPERTLSVLLDVGTNNQELLDDPLYLGWRERRVTGDDYESYIETFVEAVKRRFPNALLQWEDFAQHNASPILEKYRDKLLTFNDDIQGTAAVAYAAIKGATRAAGVEVCDQRYLIVGAGSAGTGIAAMLSDAMRRDGIDNPTAQIFLTNSKGLVHDKSDPLAPHQVPFAHPYDEVADWADDDGRIPLEKVFAEVQPTVLVGVSGQPDMFTEEMIRAMATWTDRPIILPLSNPTSKSEAKPADLVEWTDGRALVATGSPFDPVVHGGVTHHIAQANNVYVFPGVGLGAVSIGAKAITDGMLIAAADAVAAAAPSPEVAGAPVLPDIQQVPNVSRSIAAAVARQAVAEGVAPAFDATEIDNRIESYWWEPIYPQIIAI
ncbi:MAG: NAD-dependent malic enzyme [Acidimicrobiales bacterium]|nr:NAD-dependent malic enzyme [Acidimicrobiales bacterium]